MTHRHGKWPRIFFASLFVISFFAFSESSSGVTLSCVDSSRPIDQDFSDNLDQGSAGPLYNAGCQLGSANNDKPSNIDGLFGLDWEFGGKQNYEDGAFESGSNLLDLQVTGGPISGEWSILDDAFSLYENIMIVLKGGRGNPDVYVAYLLDPASGTGGSFQSPFLNGDIFKAVSHISAYYSVSPVPVPAALPLFGAALAGMGALGWRRRKATA